MELLLALGAIAGSIVVTAIFYAGLYRLIQWAASLAERHPRRGSKADERYAPSRLPSEFDLNNVSHVALLDRIRTTFGDSLQNEAGPYGQCIYKPDSTLAYPKDVIRAALTALLEFAEGRRASRLLDPALQSPVAVETIGTCLCFWTTI